MSLSLILFLAPFFSFIVFIAFGIIIGQIFISMANKLFYENGVGTKIHLTLHDKSESSRGYATAAFLNKYDFGKYPAIVTVQWGVRVFVVLMVVLILAFFAYALIPWPAGLGRTSH